jgi:branched-chain amino acid transport system permease protein
MLDYLVALLTIAAIQALLVLGLNFQYGLTGLVNFGVAGFYAIGAYATAILTMAGWPWPAALAAGVASGALASLIVGSSTPRLREDFFAIFTLAFAEFIRLLSLNARPLTRGSLGIADIPRPLTAAFSSAAYSYVFAVLVAATLIVATLLSMRFSSSPLGRTLRAIRDNEAAAQAAGKNPLLFRQYALGWGAVLAALAGSLWAHYITYVVPDQFTAEVTFYSWMAMIIGGVGSLLGSLWGSAVLVALVEGSRFGLTEMLPWLDAPRVAAVRQILIGVALMLLAVYGRRMTSYGPAKW